MTTPPLRRLLDLPGVAELETKALMKPRYADPDARDSFPDIDETSKAAFGLSLAEAAGQALGQYLADFLSIGLRHRHSACSGNQQKQAAVHGRGSSCSQA